ncbi:MAG: lytic murein transglycosylase [Candidatus Saccharibacteria bacterium]|nr:lytic murein transglycosylase [Rhodoferax sp.]
MRFRTIFTLFGSLAVVAALFFTDPDRGVGTGLIMLGILTGIIAVAFAHMSRKALFDYPEADMQKLFRIAAGSPTGAGLALVAIAIVLFALLGIFGKSAHAADVKTYVPPNAHKYIQLLKTEQLNRWPDHPRPELLAGLIEQESCLSLTHSKCWNPASKLKTPREEGAGFGQITRAYRTDGTQRFDSLQAMRETYPDLSEWSWQNVYQRPDLQLRAIVLMSRANYQALRMVVATEPRLAFADAAYNGGLAGVQSDRRACGLKTGCDPQKWFANVEATCTKSRAALYGNRSACDINREHVEFVMRVRSSKYAGLML